MKHLLLPAFGNLPLDTIRTHVTETLKASVPNKRFIPKRVNNLLASLGKTLAIDAALRL